jgi:hypothetical protein
MSEYIYERPNEPAKVVRDGWNVRIEWDFKQREEIVRCRDCKNFEPDGEPSEVYQNSYWCDKLTVYMPPDGFCSFGERREP